MPDGRPAAGTDVIEYGRHDGFPAVRTKANKSGEFVLVGIAPGQKNMILACDDVRQLKALSPIPIARLRAKPGEAVVDLVLTRPAKLVAKFRTNGKPQGRVRVDLWEELPPVEGRNYPIRSSVDLFATIRHNRDGSYEREQLPLASESHVDRDGNLSIPFLLPNWIYDLEIDGEGIERLRIADIELQAGEVRDLGVIEVGLARELELIIVDRTDKPLPHVLVGYRPVTPAGKSANSARETTKVPATSDGARTAEGSPTPLEKLFGVTRRDEPKFESCLDASDKNGRILLMQVPDRELIVRPRAIRPSKKQAALAPNEAPPPQPVVWPAALPPPSETIVPGGVRTMKIVIDTTPTSKG